MTKTDHKSSFNKSVTGSKFPSVASSPKNVKSPKSPRVTAPKVSSTTNGFHFDTMVQGAVNVQLMPLTKADNITIKLASPADSKSAAFKQENKNNEKINKMELISNNQSFQCVVYCSITETEVNLKVYLNSSSSGGSSPNDKPRIENFIQSKPILSLYSDLLMPYNILATPNDALNQLHIQQQHIHSGNTTNILFFCGDPYVRAEWAQFVNSPHHNQQTQPHNSSNFNDHISRTPVLFKTQNSLGITTAQLSPVIGTRKPLISFDSPHQQQQYSSAQQSGQSTANNQNNNQNNSNQGNQASSNQNYNPSPRSHTIHSPTPPAGTPRSFDSPVRNRSISLGADSHNRPPIVLPTSTTKSDPNAANVAYSQGVSSSGNSGDNYVEIDNSNSAGVNRHDLLKASLLKANPTSSNDYITTNNSTEIAVTKAIHSLSVDSGAQLPYGSIKITAPIQSHHTQQSHNGLSQLTEANLLMLGSTSKTTSENNMNIGVSGGISGGASVAGSTVANSTILGSNNVQNSYNYNNTPSVTNTSVHSSAYRTQAAGSFVLPGNGYSQLTVNLTPHQALSSGTATPTTYQVNNYVNSPAQSPRYNNTVAGNNGDNREHGNSGHVNSSQQQQQQAPLSRIEQLREEIEKIKQEINVTELTYQREELQLCANEEASLKDSVNTVYSSLLQQGLLPTELSAEQEKVKVWEKVQRAKNEKKSTQRLQIIETEMQSMRAEGNDLITKLLQEIKTEEERIKTEKAAAAQQDLQNQQNQHNSSTHSNNNSTQNSPTNRLQRMTERTITDTKAKFQAQIDQIRQEMIEKEASLKRDTEEKNKEEETKLQDTITAVFDSLLASTELSPTELLSEQDKVHVWENIQRAKLAKSLKQRRKNMNKEINKMLSEGREEVKRLMILQRDTSLLQNQQLLEQMNDPNYAFLETVANSNNVIVYEVDDEVVKSRTYSDLNSVQTLGDKGQVFQIPPDSIQNQLSPAVSPAVTTHKGMYGGGAGIASSNSSSVAGGIAFTDTRSRTSSDAVSTSGLGRSRASSDHDNEVTKQMREANRQAQLREILTQQELHEQKVEQDRVNRLTQQQREDEARLAAVAIQMKEQQRTQEELKAEQAAQLAALQKAENDQLIARLKQNIDTLQEQTLLAEKSLLEEEARLCIEESASLTSSVSAVYNSLLTQNLSPEKLLEEQEKVQVWEHIQRRKQQKQTNKRKAQLKTKIVLVKQNAVDKIAALTMELNNAINQHYGSSNIVSGTLDSSATQQHQQQFIPEPNYTSVDNTYNTYNNNSYNITSYDNSFINYDSNSNDDVGEETEAERKIKDYSRQQFELHSTAQRELFDKQQALLTEIANKKAQMIIEENQRLEAIRLEKEAAIQRELDRVEALRLEAEALRIAEEERLQKIADDERLAAELLEQEKQAEILRIWTEQKEAFEARIRLKLVLKIQRKFRFYQQRKILHKATTALQKVVRGYLIKNRIQKHFRHAIVLIENQSACIITNTLRQYIKHIKMKFRGWELIQELVVASVLEHCLQKREILLLRNKKKAIQKKKDKLRDQMNERESIKARKKQEKEALREAQEEEKRAQERERLAALRKEKEKEELMRAQEQEKIEAAKEKQRLLEFEKSIKRKKKT